MLYYLFEYLDKSLDVPGTGVFQYITFRSGLAVLLSLLISTIFGKRIIIFKIIITELYTAIFQL